MTQKKGVIFSENGIVMGKFEVLKVSSGEILCKSVNNGGGLHRGCYVKMDRAEVMVKKKRKPNLPVENGGRITGRAVIKIHGIRFTEHEKNIFITESPVPASIVPGVSFAGIDSFMRTIENKYENQCRVSYLTSGEMEKYLVPQKEMILLGYRNGSPVMVFFSGSGSRENPVSRKILEKLKYEFYIPLKLENLHEGK